MAGIDLTDAEATWLRDHADQPTLHTLASIIATARLDDLGRRYRAGQAVTREEIEEAVRRKLAL